SAFLITLPWNGQCPSGSPHQGLDLAAPTRPLAHHDRPSAARPFRVHAVVVPDALRLRRTLPDLHDPSFAWRGSPADVLIFDPGQTLRCVIHLPDRPFPLPGHGPPLLAAALPSQGTSPRTPPAGWTAQLRAKQRIATSVARRQNPI